MVVGFQIVKVKRTYFVCWNSMKNSKETLRNHVMKSLMSEQVQQLDQEPF